MIMAARATDRTPIAPIVRALDAIRAQRGVAAVHNVTPSLVVDGGDGWLPATRLVDGSALPEFLAVAERRWPAEPHVAAALAWKSYTYGVVLSAAVGYAAARLVPTLSADNVLVRLDGRNPFVEVGLISPQVSGLSSDRGVATVASDATLLAGMRTSLLDGHLAPMLDQLHDRVRVGHRTLLGSVASAVCHALLRASDILPGTPVPDARAILDALDLADLVNFGPGEDGRLSVQRHTCCLGFALPTPRICVGCCIPRSRIS
jgi:hypothetical protein